MTESMKDTKEGWFSENITDPEFRRGYEREMAAENFLEQVEDLMQARGISRAQLARMMECKPANITKVMRHTNNLKLSTMVDIALTLGRRVQVKLVDAVISAPSQETWHVVFSTQTEGAEVKCAEVPEKRRLWVVRDGEASACAALIPVPLAA